MILPVQGAAKHFNMEYFYSQCDLHDVERNGLLNRVEDAHRFKRLPSTEIPHIKQHKMIRPTQNRDSFDSPLPKNNNIVLQSVCEFL